jgi:hypothetical protein
LTSVTRTYLAGAAWALLGFVAAVIPIAAVVAAAGAHRERELLHFGFASVPHAPGQTVAIVAANLTVLLPCLAMAVLVQARGLCRTQGGRRAFVGFCDLVVAAPAFHNLVLVVGSAVGAYGWRMVLSMLPAGPVELAAFALAASVYLHSRRTEIVRGQIGAPARAAALSFTVLLLAAVIETYV